MRRENVQKSHKTFKFAELLPKKTATFIFRKPKMKIFFFID